MTKAKAYKVCKTANLATVATETLKMALEWADELMFAAEMCDDYTTTKKELAEIHKVFAPVKAELMARG